MWFWFSFCLYGVLDLSFVLLLVYVVMGSLSDLVVGIVVVGLFFMVLMLSDVVNMNENFMFYLYFVFMVMLFVGFFEVVLGIFSFVMFMFCMYIS